MKPTNDFRYLPFSEAQISRKSTSAYHSALENTIPTPTGFQQGLKTSTSDQRTLVNESTFKIPFAATLAHASAAGVASQGSPIPIRKSSNVSVSPTSSASSKRHIDVVNLVSSDEEDYDEDPITPKKIRHNAIRADSERLHESLRCPVPLRKGGFVDTYRGEIITVDEAEERGKKRNPDEANYFMNFDKFCEPEAISKSDFLERHPNRIAWHRQKVADEDWEIHLQDGQEMWLNPDYVQYQYVCDGMQVGGPTRFMNHSCDPNCRLFTVSYNHSDTNIYDLAFFTLEEIPAGTELTFDYKDEDDRSVITYEQALRVKEMKGYMPQRCLCGTKGCRQYFFN
ncbi:MAG: hypothetical protein Q9222_007857 [Ikaeria aurantiellina]